MALVLVTLFQLICNFKLVFGHTSNLHEQGTYSIHLSFDVSVFESDNMISKQSTIFFKNPAVLTCLFKTCLNMHIVQKAPFGTSSPANNMKTRISCHNLKYSYCLNGDKFNENSAIFTACFCGLQFLT